MLDRTSLTRAWVALALKEMVSVPPVLLTVPTVVPESTASPAVKARLPRALNTSSAALPPARARVTLAPL